MRKLGRYAEAHSALDEALKLDSQYDYALYTKGLVLDAEGNLSDALKRIMKKRFMQILKKKAIGVIKAIP